LDNKIGTSFRTSQILKKERFKMSKSLGQNFLVDQNTLRKIAEAAEFNGEELVVEIGPGVGSLTQILTEQAGQVVAVELDQRLIPILEEQFVQTTNLKIIQGDALKLDFVSLLTQFPDYKEVKLVANLPYYISTPLIMKLLTEKVLWERLVIMVKKEVAERLTDNPGSKEYGQLSVLVQYRVQTDYLFTVPPTVFIPQPKVNSAVIRLIPWKVPPVRVKNEELFFKVVKSAFAQRRKNLRNNLASLQQFGGDKQEVEKFLTQLGIDPNRRGETLSLEEFSRIANALN